MAVDDPGRSSGGEAAATGGPVRTCIGCRAARPQHELIRLFLDGAGRLQIGRTGEGRGAWLCADSASPCFARAVGRKALVRAYRRRPDPESVDALRHRLAAP